MQEENQNSNLLKFYRDKVESSYNQEPDFKTEVKEAKSIYPGSKHQQYLRNLLDSGQSIDKIQTQWHQYYISLPDHEKKEVWNEFYRSNTNLNFNHHTTNQPSDLNSLKNSITSTNQFKNPPKPKPSSNAQRVGDHIKNKITANGKLKAKQQIQSLLFGVGIGLIVLIIFLFGFFNEVIITPFIQPSSKSVSTPIIIGNTDFIASDQDQVIIPKINVQIPVDYSLTTTDESAVENNLQNGVVHYPSTVLPGQIGNAAFFGHSSNNIFNPGKYKFAFVLLHKLNKGDTFYLSYNKTMYIYKVIFTEIVSPSEVSVLGPVAGQTATATLITCDPPGTSINRLVVVGQQISPNPALNTKSTNNISTATTKLPGNGPTLFKRLMNSNIGKVIATVAALALIAYIYRMTKKYRSIY